MTISIPNLPSTWIVAFKKFCRRNNSGLSWRLLTTYLVAMAAIYGTSTAALYFFFSRSLHKQLNEQLLTLVEAAAPSLDSIKTKDRQSLDRNLPWYNLLSRPKQSLEWFDAQGNLLAHEGADFPLPLARELPSSFGHSAEGFSEETLMEAPVFQQQGQLRTVTITVYADSEQNQQQLKGYIRASESTQEIAATLTQLQLGLELGGITAWVLIGLGGIYLTRQALVPEFESLQQLERTTAAVSHHLRTPLTRISLAVELLLSDSDQIQPSQRRKIETIDSATTQITRLIEDLLFLTRNETASTANDSNPLESALSLNEVLQNLATSFQATAEEQGLELKTNLHSHPIINGNASLLKRLFSNLLENAIAYTEPGGRILVTLETKQDAVVSITDTGIGIAPELLPLVFERFWRSEQAQILNREGVGLGLTVAQAIAEQHRGKITVSSKVGTGSCFQVRLPLDESTS